MTFHHHSAIPYRREIDGLRAIAIVPVLLYHAGFEWISGGYIGVDVFFVISGYLITSIILRDLAMQRFSMLHFYERRARRILPALFFMLGACTAAAWAWMTPEELRRFGQSLVAVQLFSSNIYFWQTTNYFSPAAEELPLLHTWSLAIEEQYYLLFPILLLIIYKSGRLKLTVVTLALAVGSLAVAEWGARHSPIANFYLLPTRAWELLAGSLLAYWAPAVLRGVAGRRFLIEVGSFIGIVMVMFSIFMFDASTPFPSMQALLPVVGTILVIALATPESVTGAVLSLRPMVGIGLVSYSAYLWHQPLIVFARFTELDLSNPLAKTALALASLAIAFFSWKVVERPFRERRLLAGRSSLFAASGFGILALGGTGLMLQVGDGYPGRGNDNALRTNVSEFATVGNGWCFFSVDSIPRLPLGPAALGCVLGDRSAPQRGLLVGDSFAGHFEPFWDVLGKHSRFGIEAVTTNWCFPSLGDRYTGPATSRAREQCDFNRNYIASSLQNYDFIVVAADWRNVLKQGMLNDALEFIAETGRDGRLVIIMPTPRRFDRDAFGRMQRASFFGSPIAIPTLTLTDDTIAVEANRLVQEFSHSLPNAIFLTREQIFQVGGTPSDLTIDNITYSADGRHISVYGSMAAAEEFRHTDEFKRLRTAINAATKK